MSPFVEFNEQFAFAYDCLENGREHLFITGKAGTGKSTLLQYFRAHTRKNVVVLAPTGVAAVNVQGQTIHSFFRFKPDITPESVIKIKLRKIQKELYRKIDTIVIDEISMVRADLLDCVDTFLRLYGKEADKPFGGIQMVLFGDLYQLPPVVPRMEKDIFTDVYPSPYFFDSNVYRSLPVKVIELNKIYRQKEENFIRLLGAIRNKIVNQQHLEFLNTRYLPEFEPSDEELYIFITTTNALADQINREQLDRLKTRPYRFDGLLEGDFDTKSLPTHQALDIKFGAQIMMLNNDPKGQWVNGSLGRVAAVLGEDADTALVRVQLENGNTIDVAPFTWEMFRFSYNEETKRLESRSIGSFTQYPLKLAWAVTIHKSQGQTFEKVILDIGKGTFAHGQIYVALSRCTSLAGIVLKKPILKKHILLDWRVVQFMHTLQPSVTTQVSTSENTAMV
ncbi:MAG: PIF1 family DEAD/DEAH box helicase [Candidatus Omnitrophota bacterium]|nr:PIF1 family DEAD/DEAH box helicase [Candidatus Omnitrophota bacterium]